MRSQSPDRFAEIGGAGDCERSDATLIPGRNRCDQATIGPALGWLSEPKGVARRACHLLKENPAIVGSSIAHCSTYVHSTVNGKDTLGRSRHRRLIAATSSGSLNLCSIGSREMSSPRVLVSSTVDVAIPET